MAERKQGDGLRAGWRAVQVERLRREVARTAGTQDFGGPGRAVESLEAQEGARSDQADLELQLIGLGDSFCNH